MTSFFNMTNKFDGFSNWFINVHRFLLYYSNNNNNNGKERERERESIKYVLLLLMSSEAADVSPLVSSS